MEAEIAFAYRDAQDTILKREGFPVLPVADAVVTDFSGNVYAAFDAPLIERCIQDELAAIQTFKPDLIISAFRLTAAISARVARVPHISVVDGCMTDYFNLVEAMMLEQNPQFKLASWAVRFIQSRQKHGLARHFRDAARRRGIKQLKSLYDFLAGDLTLVADLPAFCPLRNLPENVRYIGPLVWEQNPLAVFDLPPFDPAKTLIYATAGNTGQAQFVNLVTRALGGDEAYQVILTTGVFIKPDGKPLPGNVHIEKFIPGSLVIPHAQAVIHCGGSGTTYQSLMHGAPALCIPFNNEQRINAWLIKKHRLGIPLSPVELTPPQIKETLERLLADAEIKKSVQQFRSSWDQDKAPKVAALRIANFWAERKAVVQKV